MNVHELSIRIKNKTLKDILENLFLNSLENIRGDNIVSRDVSGVVSDLTPLFMADGAGVDGYNVIDLKSVDDYVPIIGIDSSIVVVGESKGGLLFSIKGALVSEYRGVYHVFKVGPLPIYLDEDTLVSMLESINVTGSSRYFKGFLEPSDAKRFLISIFEYLLMEFADEVMDRGLIVLDGSLSLFKSFLDSGSSGIFLGRIRKNSLVGIAKKTRLVRRYPWLFSLVVRYGSPCAVSVPRYTRERGYPYNVYIGVFRRGGLPMRVDVGSLGVISDEDVLNYLYNASHTSHGYIEVLKEAHILSKMSRGELIGVKKYVESEFGVKFIGSYGLRDVIFGAFNSLVGDNNENI